MLVSKSCVHMWPWKSFEEAAHCAAANNGSANRAWFCELWEPRACACGYFHAVPVYRGGVARWAWDADGREVE